MPENNQSSKLGISFYGPSTTLQYMQEMGNCFTLMEVTDMVPWAIQVI